MVEPDKRRNRDELEIPEEEKGETVLKMYYVKGKYICNKMKENVARIKRKTLFYRSGKCESIVLRTVQH